MKKQLTLLAIAIVSFSQAQTRLVFNNNCYAVITNSANLVIDNPNANAVSTIAGGNIISEGEFNVVKWNIGASTGNYVVPFTTASLVKIPLQVNLTVAGIGGSSGIIFSTYETASDANLAYPSDVSNMNSNCNNNNALFAIDRFWRIDAGNYGTRPTPVMNFGYNDAANEMAGTNTIIESRLKAQRFNAGTATWQTPQKLYGIANAAANTVSGVSVSPADFLKSWTLIDTTIMTIPITQITASSFTTCAGDQVVITPAGATSYTLLTNNIISTNSFTVNPLSTTAYSVTGSIGTGTNICVSFPSSFATSNVNVNATPTITAASISSNTICSGQTATITPAGGTASNYTLTPGGFTGSNFTINPLTTTTYTIRGASSFGCLSTAFNNLITTITVNATPTITAASISSNTICSGQTATITPTGGTAGNYTLTPGGLTGSTFTLNPTITTLYTISGMSAAQCLSTSGSNLNTTINVNQTPSLTATQQNVRCFGQANGSVTLTPIGGTGGYTVTPIATTNLIANTYTYNVIDSKGCGNATNIFTITQPVAALSTISATTSPNTNCVVNNGVASTTVTGGTPSYSVQWSNGETGTTATALNTGLSTYTVTDLNGCTNTAGVILLGGVNGVTTAAASTSTVGCFGATSGALTFTTVGVGPFNYTLTSATNTFTSATGIFNSLSSGSYTVKVEGSGGCLDTKLISILQPTTSIILTGITSNSITCFGGLASITATATGGTGVYTYQWQNNASSNNSANYSSGNYTMSVTDANNCVTSSQPFTVTQPTSSVTVTAILNSTIACNGGTTNVIANVTGGSGNYSYNWQANSSTTNTASYSSGTYTMLVRDANNCAAAIKTIIVDQPSNAITVNETAVNATCLNQSSGSAQIIVTGGTPAYNVLWNNGSTGLSVNNVGAGIFTALVTDANNCVANYSVTIVTKTCIEFSVPQFFSPNGDGKNDALDISAASEYPNNTLSIFNRWGSLVYQKKGYTNEWTGAANVAGASGRDLLPSATYFVVFDFGDGTTKPYNGYLELRY